MLNMNIKKKQLLKISDLVILIDGCNYAIEQKMSKKKGL